jgi:ABC-type multidrug transport system fused ATPase/permease subunit
MPALDSDLRSPAIGSRLRRLEAEFLRPYRAAIVLGLLALLVQSVLLLPLPLLQGWVLDHLVALARDSRPAQAQVSAAARVIVLALAASVGCHLARMALAWRVAATMGRISQEVVVALRGALHRKLMRLPMTYFDAQQTGRLMARVTSDVGSILSFLNSGSLQLVNDLILAGGIAVLLVWLQWRLALVALVVVPLYAVSHRLFARRIHRLSQEIRAQIASIYALLGERVSAVRVVRSFAKEDAEISALDERIDAHRALSWASTRMNAYLGALATFLSGLGTVFVVTSGARLVGQGQMTVGELLAFYALIAQLYNPIVRLTQFQSTAVATAVSVERLFEIFDEPEPVADRPGALPIARCRGALEFRDVSFAYTPGGPLVLDRVNLRIEPGTTVGLLGASGAGKSTLLSLAPRIYDVPEGQGAVLLDGREIRSLRLADLRRAVALVPQQALLFEGTIRSNLTYAAPDATPDQIARALQAADLAELVRAMPRGLETPVGERGLTLSGGQRQRLALARALLAGPAVLLLDDCTSALDAETEARIRAALEDLLPGRTCVVVSHKVASVRHADRIVVLDGGRIVEQGTHAELLARGGFYAGIHGQQTRPLAVA